MPEEFDPAWEYHVADPEVEELVYARRASGLDLIYSTSLAAGGDAPRVNGRRDHGFRVGDPNYDASIQYPYVPAARGRYLPPIACARCGWEFTPPSHRKRYCSWGCAYPNAGRPRPKARRARRPPGRRCRWCKTFVPACRKNPRQRYCSIRCAKHHYWAKQRAYRRGHSPAVVVCGWCAREFTPRRGGRQYCSRKCGVVARWDRAGARVLPRNCERCLRTFVPSDSRRRYCSLACYNNVRGCVVCAAEIPAGRKFCCTTCKQRWHGRKKHLETTRV